MFLLKILFLGKHTIAQPLLSLHYNRPPFPVFGKHQRASRKSKITASICVSRLEGGGRGTLGRNCCTKKREKGLFCFSFFISFSFFCWPCGKKASSLVVWVPRNGGSCVQYSGTCNRRRKPANPDQRGGGERGKGRVTPLRKNSPVVVGYMGTEGVRNTDINFAEISASLQRISGKDRRVKGISIFFCSNILVRRIPPYFSLQFCRYSRVHSPPLLFPFSFT